MRVVSLNSASAGMDRQRPKGGASPESLFDLVNAFVNDQGVPESRPGTTRQIVLPAGTKGLCAFNGELIVFAHTAVTPPAAPFRVETIADPVVTNSPIAEIHFAAPYLGYLYVVAEFESGNTYHFWLQTVTTWAADQPVNVGDLVQPTVPGGLLFRAARLTPPNPLWAPNITRVVGEFVEPTEGGGYKFECIETAGDSPRSGETEPDWPTTDGATVTEYADSGPAPTDGGVAPTDPGQVNPGGTQPVPPFIRDRYDRTIEE